LLRAPDADQTSYRSPHMVLPPSLQDKFNNKFDASGRLRAGAVHVTRSHGVAVCAFSEHKDPPCRHKEDLTVVSNPTWMLAGYGTPEPRLCVEVRVKQADYFARVREN
jgi:hypothetical protein